MKSLAAKIADGAQFTKISKKKIGQQIELNKETKRCIEIVQGIVVIQYL